MTQPYEFQPQHSGLTRLSVNEVAAQRDAIGALGLSDMQAYVTWANILSKPSTFTPSSHVHPLSDISGLGTGVSAALAIAVGTDGGPVVRSGDIGTATGTQLTLSSNFYVGSTGAMFWTNRGGLLAPANGVVRISNALQTSGVCLDATTADTLTIKNSANSAAGAISAGNVTASGTIAATGSTIQLGSNAQTRIQQASDHIYFTQNSSAAKFVMRNGVGLFTLANNAFGWNSFADIMAYPALDDTRLSRQSEGVVQIGTTANNALGSLAAAGVQYTAIATPIAPTSGIQTYAGLSSDLYFRSQYSSCYLQMGGGGTALAATGTMTVGGTGGVVIAKNPQSDNTRLFLKIIDASNLSLRNLADTADGSLAVAGITATSPITRQTLSSTAQVLMRWPTLWSGTTDALITQYGGRLEHGITFGGYPGGNTAPANTTSLILGAGGGPFAVWGHDWNYPFAIYQNQIRSQSVAFRNWNDTADAPITASNVTALNSALIATSTTYSTQAKLQINSSAYLELSRGANVGYTYDGGISSVLGTGTSFVAGNAQIKMTDNQKGSFGFVNQYWVDSKLGWWNNSSVEQWSVDGSGNEYVRGTVTAAGTGTHTFGPSTGTTAVAVNGGNSGTGAGSGFFVYNGGATIGGIGNSSFFLGGAYANLFCIKSGPYTTAAPMAFLVGLTEYMRLSTGGKLLIGTGSDDGTNLLQVAGGLTAINATVSGTNTQGSGAQKSVYINPTYNQVTSTASNTDLLINRTQTAVGSGAQLLIDAQVGGNSRFSVSNVGTVTSSNPNYPLGTITIKQQDNSTIFPGATASQGIQFNRFGDGYPIMGIGVSNGAMAQVTGLDGSRIQLGFGVILQVGANIYNQIESRSEVGFFSKSSDGSANAPITASNVTASGTVFTNAINPYSGQSVTINTGTGYNLKWDNAGLYSNGFAQPLGTVSNPWGTVNATTLQATTSGSVANVANDLTITANYNGQLNSPGGWTILNNGATTGATLTIKPQNQPKALSIQNVGVENAFIDKSGNATVNTIAQTATSEDWNFFFTAAGNSGSKILIYGATNLATSGTQKFMQINPTWNQASGTASNTDLVINRTQTAVGSGTQLLIDAQVNTGSKFSVTNTGNVATVGEYQTTGATVGINNWWRMYSQDTVGGYLFINSRNSGQGVYVSNTGGFFCDSVTNPSAALGLSGLNSVDIKTGGTTRLQVTSSNTVQGASDNLISLGTSSVRFANLHTVGIRSVTQNWVSYGGSGADTTFDGNNLTANYATLTIKNTWGAVNIEGQTAFNVTAGGVQHLFCNSGTSAFTGNITATGTVTATSTGVHTFGTTNTVTLTAGAIAAAQGTGSPTLNIANPGNSSPDACARIGTASAGLWVAGANYGVRATAGNATTVPFTARGFASQTANLLECQNSAATNMFAVTAGTASGVSLQLFSNGGTFSITTSGNNAYLGGNHDLVLNGVRAGRDVGGTLSRLTVKGEASQTANLQEWQNSAGTVLASVGPTGTVNARNYTLTNPNNSETAEFGFLSGSTYLQVPKVWIGANSTNQIRNLVNNLEIYSGNTGYGTVFNGSGGAKLGVNNTGNPSGWLDVRNDTYVQKLLVTDTATTVYGNLFVGGSTSDYFSNISAGTNQWQTAYAGTFNFKSNQSGQSMSLLAVTAEGKTGGLQHWDVAHANGRRLDLASSPGVPITIRPAGVLAATFDASGNTVLAGTLNATYVTSANDVTAGYNVYAANALFIASKGFLDATSNGNWRLRVNNGFAPGNLDVGAVNITSTATTTAPLIVNGTAGQGNLMQCKDYLGSIQLQLNNAGSLAANRLELRASAYFAFYNSGNSLKIDTYDGFELGLNNGSGLAMKVDNNLNTRFYGPVTSTFQSLSANPSTVDLTAGQSRLVKNTTSGVLSLWANDGGTMKSVALT